MTFNVYPTDHQQKSLPGMLGVHMFSEAESTGMGLAICLSEKPRNTHVLLFDTAALTQHNKILQTEASQGVSNHIGDHCLYSKWDLSWHDK